ncbi:HAD family phosphatase [Olsenella sp. HMSC062G07]|uniref:HAD family hydrolase n=1 Tax=Olsenella sp. HMSC062G07 TaxID=1739330 RepID=UPI0008A36830|nr:HAD family phosphatase [Olsenella sp. HMSC062G07]OFK23700.1 hypothetical protein HMPREF2826_04170 [Olsenella sp. HMSC062G07]
MERVGAVIFDMDGLVLDTESICYEAYLRAARRFDFTFDERVHMYLAGRTEDAVISGLRRLYGPDKDVIAWRRFIVGQKAAVLRERGLRAGKRPGVVELLSFLTRRGIPHALASSSSARLVHDSLASERLVDAFPVKVTGDMVRRSKPDPEAFLRAAALLQVEPSRCLVLEDSAAGVRAAVAGGFIPVFVHDDMSQEGRVDGACKVLMELEDPRGVARLARFAPADLAGVIPIIEQLNA